MVLLNHLGAAVAALTVPAIDSLTPDPVRDGRIAPKVRLAAKEISLAIGGVAPGGPPIAA